MTKLINTAVLLAAIAAPGAAIAQAPAAAAPAAPAAATPAYPAIADFAAAVRLSNAYQAAVRQIQTQYKPQIDTYNTRSAPLQQELQRNAQEIRTLQQNNTPEATVNQRIQAFQTRQQAIQAELAPLAAPFERPLAYAEEQVSSKLDQATRNAMAAKRVNVLIRPEAIAFALPTANLTGDIVTQLNSLVPTVSTTVPANWQPGGQSAPGAAPAGAPTAPGTRPATTGRDRNGDPIRQ